MSRTCATLETHPDRDRSCRSVTRLLEFATGIAAECGAASVVVRTYAASYDVIAFYGKNAFHPIAVVSETNGPDDEGTIVMRKRL